MVAVGGPSPGLGVTSVGSGRRIQRQPAWILQRYPFGESSLMVDSFTLAHGRVMMLAKGARRMKSPYRGILQAFQDLRVGWSGRRELVTLTRAESSGPWRRLRGSSLMCGWYANELLMRFLQRGDPHEQLFEAYSELMMELGSENDDWTLRRFEKVLLSEVGYGMVLDREVHAGEVVEADRRYRYLPGRGPVIETGDGFEGVAVSGATLLALRESSLPSRGVRREARRLTSRLLAVQLDGRVLQSPGVLRQMTAATPRDAGDVP